MKCVSCIPFWTTPGSLFCSISASNSSHQGHKPCSFRNRLHFWYQDIISDVTHVQTFDVLSTTTSLNFVILQPNFTDVRPLMFPLFQRICQRYLFRNIGFRSTRKSPMFGTLPFLYFERYNLITTRENKTDIQLFQTGCTFNIDKCSARWHTSELNIWYE